MPATLPVSISWQPSWCFLSRCHSLSPPPLSVELQLLRIQRKSVLSHRAISLWSSWAGAPQLPYRYRVGLPASGRAESDTAAADGTPHSRVPPHRQLCCSGSQLKSHRCRSVPTGSPARGLFPSHLRAFSQQRFPIPGCFVRRKRELPRCAPLSPALLHPHGRRCRTRRSHRLPPGPVTPPGSFSMGFPLRLRRAGSVPVPRYLSCTTSSQLSTTVRPDTVAIVACTVDTSLQAADRNRVRARPCGPPTPPRPAPVPSAEQDAVLDAPSRRGPTQRPHAEREQPREEGGRDRQRPPHGARAAATARRGTTAPGGGSPAPASPAPRREATPPSETRLFP